MFFVPKEDFYEMLVLWAELLQSRMLDEWLETSYRKLYTSGVSYRFQEYKHYFVIKVFVSFYLFRIVE